MQLEDLALPLMIDDRWEQDTLFLVFKEDSGSVPTRSRVCRLSRSKPRTLLSLPPQAGPRGAADRSALLGSDRCGVSSSQTMARVYWPPQTPEAAEAGNPSVQSAAAT